MGGKPRKFEVGDFVDKNKCTYKVLSYFKGTYTVECDVCNNDKELFPVGTVFYLTANTSSDPDSYCCGCSNSYKYYSNEQKETLCRRKAMELGAKYLGSYDNKLKAKSKIKLLWEKDKVCTFTSTVSMLFSGKVTNPVSSLKEIRKKTRVDDRVMIDFLRSKGFLPDTVSLYRDEAMNKPNRWIYECSVCKEDDYSKLGGCTYKFRTHMSNLKQGKIPCRCSLCHTYSEQERRYDIHNYIGDYEDSRVSVEFVGGFKGDKSIVIIRKDGVEVCLKLINILREIKKKPKVVRRRDMWLYLTSWVSGDGCKFFKYGITEERLLKTRVKTQESRSDNCQFKELLFLYLFSTYEQCYFAELVVKNLLKDFNKVSKDMFIDGYTETITNIDVELLTNILCKVSIYVEEYNGEIYSKNRPQSMFNILFRLNSEFKELLQHSGATK